MIVLRKIKNEDGYDTVRMDGAVTYDRVYKFLKPYALAEKVTRNQEKAQSDDPGTNFVDVNANDFMDKINKLQKPVIVHVVKGDKHKAIDKVVDKYQ